MKLNFMGQTQGLEEGIAVLGKKYGFEVTADGIPVEVELSGDPVLEARLDKGQGHIKCSRKIHFFRALGLFVEALRKSESFSIVEEPQFTMNGMMLDVSRNAVMQVESIKRFIEQMAVMGLNLLMLYAEDTYTVESRPYFGYMRGRYSYDELKECDDYAEVFGVEIVPCIQTLAHLTAALKWNYAANIKDTEDILLVGEEKTYEFIEEMIKAASAPFRSKRIHIGMDEAHNLGLGKYLDIHGYRRRFDIMNEHLARVKDLAYKNGLKPMLWADMYFRLASKTGAYYDMNAVIPEDVINGVSKDAQLVYWDYYHDDMESYREMIRRHQRLGCDTVFAGGIWTWNGIAVNYTKTFLSTNAALEACKQEGIKEVFATMWGDNGGETNYFSALIGMQLYAEHGYSREFDREKLKQRFHFCTGGSYEDFMLLDRLDNIPPTAAETMRSPSNPSKLILWQDVLLGLFDRHFEGLDLKGYYEELGRELEACAESAGEWGFVFDMPGKLAEVLSRKADIGIRAKACYDAKDRNGLKELAENDLPMLHKSVEVLRVSHRRQWMKTYKPFGWEVMDIRYGGVLARIDTAIARITEYLDGTITKIEELEEERLFFDGPERPQGQVIGRFNTYHRIATACALGFNG